MTVTNPELVIYDLVSGRVAAGHQEDYLASLERALVDFSPETVAPFRGTGRVGRLRRWVLGYRVFNRALSSGVIVLVPNAGPLDFVLLYLAGWGWRRPKRGRVAVVMRRDAIGIVGGRVRAAILGWIVGRMARQPFFVMVSDARTAADYWTARTNRRVLLVSIPVRESPASLHRPRDDEIRVGLLGAFRIEKGAAHYGKIIAETLDIGPDTRVECQCFVRPDHPRDAELAATLENWSNHPRVTYHRGHLESDAYTRLLYSVDIVVLPYDVESYGPGTSGVLFEALSAGRIVVSTRIAWAVSEYAQHPHMVWLEDISSTSVAQGLARACSLAREERRKETLVRSVPDYFQSTWLAALDDIQRDLDVDGLTANSSC